MDSETALRALQLLSPAWERDRFKVAMRREPRANGVACAWAETDRDALEIAAWLFAEGGRPGFIGRADLRWHADDRVGTALRALCRETRTLPPWIATLYPARLETRVLFECDDDA